MTEQTHDERLPSNDHRPNSGLREGDSTHADVNEAVAVSDKTVIFGQQTRLRLGELTEDEKLSRYHAGHDLVKFFYGGVRQIPEHVLDAILGFGISVTMVQGTELLVFNHPRSHQSLHTGYTRKTIYMPEAVLKASFEKGYDYWVISEVIIQESWPLMDYLAILELARRSQQRLRERSTIGYSFIKDGLRRLAPHRLHSEQSEDNEFMHLYRHYQDRLMAWDRSMLDRDPYDLADEVFDEPRERKWAKTKIYDIATTFGFPDLFDLDRDIVHPAAFEMAEQRGQPVSPQSAADAMHDLTDAARFRVSRQIKTDDLMDHLIGTGAPGIKAFVEGVAQEKASGFEEIVKNRYDGYDAMVEFKKLLQKYSETDLEGLFGSISNDFNDLYGQRVLHNLRVELDRFAGLPKKDQEENLTYLRDMAVRMVGATRPDLDAAKQVEAVATPKEWSAARCVRHWHDMAVHLLSDVAEEMDTALLATIVRKLDRHPLYHSLFRQQVDELTGEASVWKEDVRTLVEGIWSQLPEQPYRFSSDAGGVSSRLRAFQRLRRNKRDDPELLNLLAGIIVRLDRAEQYGSLVQLIAAMVGRVTEALEETVEQISFRDEGRRLIRDMAQKLLDGSDVQQPLAALPDATPHQPVERQAHVGEHAGAEEQPHPLAARATGEESRTQAAEKVARVLPENEQMSERVLVMAFYHLIGERPGDAQLTEGVAALRELAAQGIDQEQIKAAIRESVEEAPHVKEFATVLERVSGDK